jgi:hypothetical protein
MSRITINDKVYEGEEISLDNGLVKVDGRIVYVIANTGVTVIGDVWGEVRAGTGATIVGSALGGIKAGTVVTVGNRDDIAVEAQEAVAEALRGRL